MPDPLGYEWDIFISYPRRDPVGPWVQDHFFPLFEKWMGAAMKTQPRLFLDYQMENGTDWPSNISYSLNHSRYMVAIWAPPYFGSQWCLAEWENMRKRQEQLGLGKDNIPGLIYPIRFFDGESFPREALSTQEDQDYTRFNSFPPGKATLRSRTYQQFEARIKKLSLDLEKRIQSVPPWSPNWPKVETPAPIQAKSLPFAQVGLP
jgi:hypothetical protein